MSRWEESVRARARSLLDQLRWSAAHGAVDAIRYRPAGHVPALRGGIEIPDGLIRLLGPKEELPAGEPDRVSGTLSELAGRWLGPVGSALARFFSSSAPGRVVLDSPLARASQAAILVPHVHPVAVLAVDMRGFSRLTTHLDDTQYLTDLIEEYLSVLTDVVEADRGIVFQYTGDGFLALFVPELTGLGEAEMLDRMVNHSGARLHHAFAELRERWRQDWAEQGRDAIEIGLGAGVSFGPATIGLIGPRGKKQFGIMGPPVNQAAFLCSQAKAGTVLVDCESWERAGAETPRAWKRIRLKSEKLHQRICGYSVRHAR